MTLHLNTLIEGTAKNGDGLELALYIPSLNLDNRIIAKIKNGKFIFKGNLRTPERAVIAFEEEFYNPDEAYYSYDLFLNKDSIKLDVDISRQFNSYYFKKATITHNDLNIYYQQTKSEFEQTYGDIMINPQDTLLMDSLKRIVFPEIRKKILKKYSEFYSTKEFSIIGLFYLRHMLEDRFMFDYNDLMRKDKNKLISYFEQIDTILMGTPDYSISESLIHKFNTPSNKIIFIDFALINNLNRTVKLSDIIKANKFTIIDFWWSGCVPCRKFNKESQKDYPLLKSKKIEIISVNVDKGMVIWQKASGTDSLSWINLYARANSKIQAEYDVNEFPTKLIFDNNLNFIDFKFSKAVELLELTN